MTSIITIIVIGTGMIGFMIFGQLNTAFAEEDSATAPEGAVAVAPYYVTGDAVAVAPGYVGVGDAIVRVYQDEIPWFGENRDRATLLGLGKVIGTDYFIHPTSDLLGGIPSDTDVVILTSAVSGQGHANVNSAAAQANLDTFVQAGGVLIVDMGDNVGPLGYLAPGSI